ncbi:MAG TPA: hypothetical protein VGD56_02690 [Gemmatirosa sp.]
MGGDATGTLAARTAPAGIPGGAGPELADVQGFVLRSYAMPTLRVLVLRVVDAAGARGFLGTLVQTDGAGPRLATGAPWGEKPSSCVNVGLTYAGLVALGLSTDSLASFPEEFVAGAAARATCVGDVGDSAPAAWDAVVAPTDAHVFLFVFAAGEAVRDAVCDALRAAYAVGGALTELGALDAGALPGDVAHFGYRDGFSQPTIDGGLPPAIPDLLPPAPAGEFVLGYPSQYADLTYPVPAPAALGQNGSFAAVRILEQDCDAFERFLRDAGAQTGLDPELVAAKLCGRWRNGVPLALSPTTDAPDPPIPLERMNSFDYAPTALHPEVYDDRKGYRCPIGAHMRRANPRSSAVAGSAGLKRRIVRRGLPYGPAYDPSQPHDGVARGLLGLFIGVSLKDQFEFVMAEWVNDGAFAPGLGTTRDPVLGDNTAEASRFVIPVDGGAPIALSGFSRFVRTRGGAYCFLPSVTALRFLAGGAS